MLQKHLSQMLIRDLGALRREIEAYPDELALWAQPPGVPNSAGTLTLHLVGNLQHFIGAVLGETGYVRNREAEFASRNVPRATLLGLIDDTVNAIRRTLETLDPGRLSAQFPLPVGPVVLRTDDFLVHLATHLTYHLGQLDYHRRFVTGASTGVGAITPTELATARPKPAG